MYYPPGRSTSYVGCFSFLLVPFLICFAGYITHIVHLIGAAAESGSAIALLLIGLFFFPVGVVHGWSVWFGWYWI